MKKLIFTFFILSILLLNGWTSEKVHAMNGAGAVAAATVTAQDPSGNVTLQTDSASTANAAQEKPFNWKGLIIGILFLCFYGFAIVWIIITLVNNKKTVPVSKQEYLERRKLANKSPEATKEENDQAYACTEEAFQLWKVISEPNEEEMRSPVTMSQIKKSLELHAKAVSLMPTEDVVVDRINEMGGVLNTQQKRSFSGSWKLIITAVIACLIMFFLDKSSSNHSFWHFIKSFWFIPAGIILYYFASLAPSFLINKRSRWFRGKNIHNVLLGTIMGLFLATPATETWVTHWSDGSKTRSDEINPFFIVMMILTFLVILISGFLIGLFAGINFIRNYLVYL